MNFSIFINVFLHLDRYLNFVFGHYSVWAYALLFAVIFIETGLVVTPFLPGDSLIFATAALSATAHSPVNVPFAVILFLIAAIGGDTMNYHIGHKLRDRINKKEQIRFIKMEYIERTHAFFERHGGKTITIARFIPIIRTFAPFVAGVSEMSYRHFIRFNIIGGTLWVALMFSMGYFFGNIPYVKSHFSLVLIGIIVISVLPVLISYIVNRMKKAKNS